MKLLFIHEIVIHSNRQSGKLKSFPYVRYSKRFMHTQSSPCEKDCFSISMFLDKLAIFLGSTLANSSSHEKRYSHYQNMPVPFFRNTELRKKSKPLKYLCECM
ncbi:hypothetical protein EUGRSUZ_C02800 [Eucalyptus grandis]|uniref:Uncharacterized protein n=2 Tax=Eucalyptus grandis TaxID=71139 RepID=A0ACC3LIG5_EUCGR|nr:hypothetical protein EUGRSUZ_C02800 [Eucalyptus grandis]